MPYLRHQAANARGVKIYTVGVGTAKGGPIPIKQNGIVTSYKKDIEGNVVVTKADSQTLKNIASAASGDYIDGTSTATVVNKIKDVLGKNAKNEYGEAEVIEYKDRYQWFARSRIAVPGTGYLDKLPPQQDA